MSKNDEASEMIRARTDLIDLIRSSREDLDTLIEIIENELKDIREGDTAERISRAVSRAAEGAGTDTDSLYNILYWLTQSGPDARQAIVVQTLETMMNDDELRDVALAILERLSSRENVDIVLRYVEKGVLTLGQAIFVLLYPDADQVLTG